MKFNISAWALWSTLVVVGLSLPGCATSPGATMQEAISANKGVIISPLLGDSGTVWARQDDPSRRFVLLPQQEVSHLIGQNYQMQVVEPGRYVLLMAILSAGPGRFQPRGVVSSRTNGAIGQVVMGTTSFRESYTVEVWKDAIVQQVNVSGSSFCASMGPYGDCYRWVNNPGYSYPQVVQEAGYYTERRYKPPVDHVLLQMEFPVREPLAYVDVRAGEALLINQLRMVDKGMERDDAHCAAAQERGEHACPLHRARAEIAQIDLADFQRQARAPGSGQMDAALVGRVRAAPLVVSGNHLGQNGRLAIYGFGRR